MLRQIESISPSAIITKATSISGTLCKILDFAKIPEGWAYGRGHAIGADVIGQAIELNAFLGVLNFKDTDAFPAENGDIEIAAYDGDTSIYIQLDGKTYSVRKEDGDQEVLYKPNEDAKTTYNRLVELVHKCALYALPVQSTSNQKETDFAVWHLQNLAPTMQHLSSCVSVSALPTWESVSTLWNTMRTMSPETLQSSQSLNPTTFPLDMHFDSSPVIAEMSATG